MNDVCTTSANINNINNNNNKNNNKNKRVYLAIDKYDGKVKENSSARLSRNCSSRLYEKLDRTLSAHKPRQVVVLVDIEMNVRF